MSGTPATGPGTREGHPVNTTKRYPRDRTTP